MLAWDGSALPNYPCSPFLYTWRYNTGKYGIFVYHNTYHPVQISRCKSKLPVIIDEFKNLFNLPKRGSHTFYVGKILYTIYKLDIYHNLIYQEIPLSQTSSDFHSYACSDKIFSDHMQLSLIFCLLMRITATESKIFVKVNQYGEKFYHVPIVNADGKLIDKESISNILRKRWSCNLTTQELYQELTGPIDLAKLWELKCAMDNIISRIDNSYNWYSTMIYTRLLPYVK